MDQTAFLRTDPVGYSRTWPIRLLWLRLLMTTREGFPFRFTCKRSGNCCAIPGGFVRLGQEDVRAIAEHLGISVEAFGSRYLQPDGERLKEGLGNRCVFLQDGTVAGCSIYDVRPQKCRDWPFWPEVLTDPRLPEPRRPHLPGHRSRGRTVAK